MYRDSRQLHRKVHISVSSQKQSMDLEAGGHDVIQRKTI